MHLVTAQYDNCARAALLLDGRVLDLANAGTLIPEALGLPLSMRAMLSAGDTALVSLRHIRDRALAPAMTANLEEIGALKARSEVKLLAPIPDPTTIIAAGSNFRAHMLEMGGPLPAEPLAFQKNPNAVIGPDDAITLPGAYPDMVDWEAEFAAVIGRPCHNASAAEALTYVAGYVMINDVSARNWALPFSHLTGMDASQAWDRNILGKQFPTFCPMGPALALKDEIPDPTVVNFNLSVNGTIMQSACTDDLIFSVADMIAHYSRFYRFLPGDIISTGSPAGVGMVRKPPVFLKAGDIVEVNGEGIGMMRNRVIA